MLKNKKVLFLILLVLIIWGYILYKLYINLNGAENTPLNKKIVKQINDNSIDFNEDTLNLALNYKDPFKIGENIKEKDEVNYLINKNLNDNLDNIIEKELKQIKIIGIFDNGKYKSVELKIKNIENNYLENEFINSDIFIHKIYKDSLILKINNKLYTLK